MGGLLWLTRHLGRRRFPGAPRASQQHLVEPTPGPEDRQDIFEGARKFRKAKIVRCPADKRGLRGRIVPVGVSIPFGRETIFDPRVI